MALHGVTCSEVTVVYTRVEGDDTLRERSEPAHVRFENLADYLNSFFWRTEMDVTEIISVSLQNICTGSPDSNADDESDPDVDSDRFETETETESDNGTECVSDFDEDADQFESESSSESDSDANCSGTDCD
jgi:hypothetical protein